MLPWLSNVVKCRINNCQNIKSLSYQGSVLFKQKRSASIRLQPKEEKANTEFLKWILLAIPVTTFTLGCWQVKRRQWKLDLIKNLDERIRMAPIPLPETLEALNEMEYRTVTVRGRFLHEREFTIGPRSKIDQSEKSSSTNFFKNTSSGIGYFVITPFKLSDRDQVILINRGWVHNKFKNQSTRPSSLIDDNLEVEGIVRLQEKRGQFMPKNNPSKEQWMYRDIEEMGKTYGTSPVWLDLKDSNVTSAPPSWPLPNQTRVTLRNEHTSYIITWFGLCGITTWMWIRLYINKLPLP